MSAYVVGDIEVTDPEGYEEYRAGAPGIIQKYGGRYLVRGGATEVMEGTWDPHRIVVLEFPDADSAKSFLNDPEYVALKQIRLRCSTGSLILVQGV
jgi:uncharacterized protein (DUF1330 family)